MKLLGGLLFGCGIMIALLFGACTVIFIVSATQSPYVPASEQVWFILLWGVLPLIVGIAMVWAGWRVLKGDDRANPPLVPERPPAPDPSEEPDGTKGP